MSDLPEVLSSLDHKPMQVIKPSRLYAPWLREHLDMQQKIYVLRGTTFGEVSPKMD
jgi:hypothetical protein